MKQIRNSLIILASFFIPLLTISLINFYLHNFWLGIISLSFGMYFFGAFIMLLNLKDKIKEE
jgi:hypothetical protein